MKTRSPWPPPVARDRNDLWKVGRKPQQVEHVEGQRDHASTLPETASRLLSASGCLAAACEAARQDEPNGHIFASSASSQTALRTKSSTSMPTTMTRDQKQADGLAGTGRRGRHHCFGASWGVLHDCEGFLLGLQAQGAHDLAHLGVFDAHQGG